jgi:hypothetical protein
MTLVLSIARTILLALTALLGLAGSASASSWVRLPVQWTVSPGPLNEWFIGGDAPNPVASLPIDRVAGHWVRFSGTAAQLESGINFWLNVYEAEKRVTARLPTLCAESGTEHRCTTVTWVPASATKVDAVIWASRVAGTASTAVLEVSIDDGAGPGLTDRSQALVATMRARYYRTGEVDWEAIERALSAMPSPPADVDPLPTVARFVLSRLPGNTHSSIVPRSWTKSGAIDEAFPECGLTAGWGIVRLPGFSAIDGPAPARYAAAAHDCLMRAPADTPWVVDLRDNRGGNMYPMIGGIAPLLPAGKLYAFVDGHGAQASRISVGSAGVAEQDQVVGGPTPDVGLRASAPVIVVFGPRCASSCEQVANALAARARTLFVGEPTAGFTSVNEWHPLNDDYVLALTESLTADPCGRVIRDRLTPDVAIAKINDKQIADILADASVATWMAKTIADARHPVSLDELAVRCRQTARFLSESPP